MSSAALSLTPGHVAKACTDLAACDRRHWPTCSRAARRSAPGHPLLQARTICWCMGGNCGALAGQIQLPAAQAEVARRWRHRSAGVAHDPSAMPSGMGEQPPARVTDEELLGLADRFIERFPGPDEADPGLLQQIVGILADVARVNRAIRRARRELIDVMGQRRGLGRDIAGYRMRAFAESQCVEERGFSAPGPQADHAPAI